MPCSTWEACQPAMGGWGTVAAVLPSIVGVAAAAGGATCALLRACGRAGDRLQEVFGHQQAHRLRGHRHHAASLPGHQARLQDRRQHQHQPAPPPAQPGAQRPLPGRPRWHGGVGGGRRHHRRAGEPYAGGGRRARCVPAPGWACLAAAAGHGKPAAPCVACIAFSPAPLPCPAFFYSRQLLLTRRHLLSAPLIPDPLLPLYCAGANGYKIFGQPTGGAAGNRFESDSSLGLPGPTRAGVVWVRLHMPERQAQSRMGSCRQGQLWLHTLHSSLCASQHSPGLCGTAAPLQRKYVFPASGASPLQYKFWTYADNRVRPRMLGARALWEWWQHGRAPTAHRSLFLPLPLCAEWQRQFCHRHS